MGKIVIPISFGPYEDPKLTNYLITSWFKKETPQLKTPKYVRDYIHASLLAKYYLYFADKVIASKGELKINPSGYRGTVADFSMLVAREMTKRLGIECKVTMPDQTEFSEPLERVNTDDIQEVRDSWKESAAWDQLAEFYKNR